MPLSASILSALQAQYEHERYNEHRYMIRASLADYYGLTNIKDFFLKQASGERDHAMQVFNYILDRGERIKNNMAMFDETLPDSMLAVFETALAVETDTTEKLKSLYALACSEGDYLTSTWLVGGLLPEQVEEESLYLTILDRYRTRLNLNNASGEDNTSMAAELGAALHDVDIWIGEKYNG